MTNFDLQHLDEAAQVVESYARYRCEDSDLDVYNAMMDFVKAANNLREVLKHDTQ